MKQEAPWHTLGSLAIVPPRPSKEEGVSSEPDALLFPCGFHVLLALLAAKPGDSAGLTAAEKALFAREHARAHAENNASNALHAMRPAPPDRVRAGSWGALCNIDNIRE